MCAARVARDGPLPVLFIPLHQLNVAGALVDAVGEYVRLADLLPVNPLDPEAGEERLLIIFDGLDELSLQGRVGAEAARDFVREVLKAVEIRNETRRRLLVMLTGRELVIHASESEFRDRHRLLHVLPYLVDQSEQEAWKSGRELLAEDSRQSWWRLYGEASGQRYAGLPKELSRDDLDEITSQPLLNYLVALSHSRGRLDFSRDLNLNAVYEDLLEAVHERAYEQKRPHPAIQGLTLAEFRRVLEEVALAAWHGNGRTTSVGEIEAHCQAAGLSSLLERFAEGAKTGVARVLTAFYFRQFGRTAGGDPTFEFTHKSFREYLTALRIVRGVERMTDELERRRKNLDAGWDERDALKHWAEIAGPTRMDWELWAYVHREIALRGVESAKEWQGMLCRLIASMLRNGMPMELLASRPSYQEQARQARNAEESLLAVLNACAQVTREISRVDWPEAEGEGGRDLVVGSWIRRLQGQRTGDENVLALRCLSLLDLSQITLHVLDLHGAIISHSRLKGTLLAFASLVAADFREANLNGAWLVCVNLERANLQGANLQEAQLMQANLERANLERANLTRANLTRANLERANLKGANLEGANLEGANLQGANLQAARVEKTRGLPADLRLAAQGHSGQRHSQRRK